MAPRRAERGGALTEYLALLGVLGALVAALAAGPARAAAATLAEGLRDAVCRAFPACAPGAGSGTPTPDDIADAAAALADAEGDPQAVADVFAALDPEVAAALAHEHPELVGDLDGAPPALRYLANRLLIEQEAARLRAEREELVAAIADADGFVREALEDALGELDGHLALLDRLASPDRQILLFDPEGDGRVAEVLGDLGAAEHLALVVPGVGNDLESFEGGPLADAQSLQAEALAQDPGAHLAVIAALTYDPPDSPASLDAARADSAEGAADVLPGFLAGVDVHTGADLTVIGHSYGSVAVSLSAQDGMDADRIVFIGSPGVRADDAAELGGAEVYAAESPEDPIRFVPNVIVGGLGHGQSPVDPGFGAQVFGTGPVGHSGYYDPGTLALENLARIVLGTTDEVTPP